MGRTFNAMVSALVGLTVAACTSSPPAAIRSPSSARTSVAASAPAPPTPSPPPSNFASAVPITSYPRLPIPAGTPRCHTSQLEVSFRSNGAAAGRIEYTFEWRNQAKNPCWVYGFVGFQTIDSNGRPLAQTIKWTTELSFGRSDPPSRILLPSDTAALGSGQGTGHAFFNVVTNDVLCDTSQNPVALLEIWPPDETAALRIAAQTAAGAPFIFCTDIELNPLQVQETPRLD